MSYAVVKFIKEMGEDEHMVSEIPASWLTKDNTFCKWPPKHVGIYINKNVPPQDDWEEHPVIVECFCGNIYI